MSEPTIADVLAAVQALAARVDSLETELAAARADRPPQDVPGDIPDDVIVAITAAVAAFLGHRARLTQVRYRTGGGAWTQQGRAAVQDRTVGRRGEVRA